MPDISKNIPAGSPEEKKLVPEKKDVWSVARKEAEMRQQAEEKKETLPAEQENDVISELRQEIKEMELDPSMKAQAKKTEEKIEFLGEKQKLEHLLALAKTKGVEYAVKEAKKMGDSYILDLFHDLLIKEGFYKNVLNQVAQSSFQNPPPPPAQASAPTPPPVQPKK